MSYKYDKPPKRKIYWVKLVKEYRGEHRESFPKDLKVGDKTWVFVWDHYHTHIENNRYGRNFEKEYFELVSNDIYSEPIYEIY